MWFIHDLIGQKLIEVSKSILGETVLKPGSTKVISLSKCKATKMQEMQKCRNAIHDIAVHFPLKMGWWLCNYTYDNVEIYF